MSGKPGISTGTVTSSASSTITGGTPGGLRDTSFKGDFKPDEFAAYVEQITLKRAESLVNERLSAATQAHEITTKMLNEATDALSKSTALLNGGETLMKSLTAGLETSSRMQERLESDIANIKGSAVSALSIFVSFFAFITVSINVFSKAGSVVSAAALVLIFWCLLVGFNIIIGWQFDTLKNTGLAWFLLIFVSFLSVFAVMGMFYFAPEVLAQQKPVIPSAG